MFLVRNPSSTCSVPSIQSLPGWKSSLFFPLSSMMILKNTALSFWKMTLSHLVFLTTRLRLCVPDGHSTERAPFWGIVSGLWTRPTSDGVNPDHLVLLASTKLFHRFYLGT